MAEPKLQPTLADELEKLIEQFDLSGGMAGRDASAILAIGKFVVESDDCIVNALRALEAISAENAKLREALAVIAYEGPEEPWLVAHHALKSTARPLAALKEPRA